MPRFARRYAYACPERNIVSDSFHRLDDGCAGCLRVRRSASADHCQYRSDHAVYSRSCPELTFGPATNIDTTATFNTDAVSGGAGTAWTVTNQGILKGNRRGVSLGGAGSTLTNSGTISENSNLINSGAVVLDNGGTIDNQTNGTISGISDGVRVDGAAGTVTNAGTITTSGGAAVFLVQNGDIANQQSGKISGHFFGVLVRGLPAGTITNAGSITATDQTGIGVSGRVGTLTNQSGGTISGGTNGAGVDLSGSSNATVTNEKGATIGGGSNGLPVAGIVVNGSVINAGTISGVTASVQFTGTGTNTLTLQTGSVLNGDAVGSTATGATNKLVLLGDKGISNNNFRNFNMLDVGAMVGGTAQSTLWTLNGNSAVGTTRILNSAALLVGDATHPGALLTGNVTARGGVLGGNGTVDGDVTGGVHPGYTTRASSTLTVTGNVTFDANSIFRVNANSDG